MKHNTFTSTVSQLDLYSQLGKKSMTTTKNSTEIVLLNFKKFRFGDKENNYV